MARRSRTRPIFTARLAGRSLTASILFALVALAPGTGAADDTPLDSGARPRVLLTARRVAELRAVRHTSHREAFAVAKGEADAYLTLPLPADRSRAINAYRAHGRTLPALALMYRLTGDTAYLEAARRWLFGLVRFDTWDGSANLGRAAFATGVSLAYDWLHGVLSPGERAEIRARLLAEGRILAPVVVRQTRLLSNHLHNELCGLALIGYALWGEEPEAQRFVVIAEEKAALTLDHAPLDGAWPEGVSYWGYGVSYLLRMIEAKRLLGRGDDFATSGWLRRTGDYFVYLSLPEAHWAKGTVVANIADAPLHGGGNSGMILRRLASAYGNGVYQRLADTLMPLERTKEFPPGWRDEALGAWMHLLWYDPAIQPATRAGLPTLRHFSDLDLVSMRSDWGADAAVLLFHAGPGPGHRNQTDSRRVELHGFGPGHTHPDINAFSLFARGQWLAVDPGYSEIKDTRDHNTVVVSGKGQAGEGDVWLDYWAFQERKPAPSVSSVESHPVCDSVIGDAGNVYRDAARLARFRRQVVFLKPDVFVIADDLAAYGPSHFEWLLHAPAGSLFGRADGAFEVVRPGARLFVRPLRPEGAPARVISRVTRSQGFDPTACLVVDVKHATSARPLTVLAVLADGEPAPAIAFEGDDLRIRKGGRDWRLRIAGALSAASVSLIEVVSPRLDPALTSYHFVR